MAESGRALEVLVLTNLFPSNVDPTFAPFNRQQLARLGERASVEVLGVMPWRFARRLTRGRNQDVARRETIDGLPVTHPRFVTVPGVPALNAASVAAAVLPELLVRRARGARWDVLLACYAYPDGCAGVLLGQALGLPVVVKCHGSDLNRVPASPALKLQLRALLPRAARVVCVSRKLGERALALGVDPSRLDVVYNGVDRERFAPRDPLAARRRLGLAEDGEWVIGIGHLEPHKGTRDLLAAAERLRVMRPSARVLFLGDGPLAPEVRSAERASGGAVRLVGHVPHAMVPDYLAAADLLCLPSWDEGMPNVVREAHAAGRRVVGTRVGGVPEAVHAPELGCLVPPRDAAALAEALARTLATPSPPPERIVALGLVPSWAESAEALHAVLERAARR